MRNNDKGPQKKMFLKIKGLDKEVSISQFKKVKALDKKKLISERDQLKANIKFLEKEYQNLQEIYDPEIMIPISNKREKELRTTIYHLEKSLYMRINGIFEDPNQLYKEILENIKEIYHKVLTEIEAKKKDIGDRINLRIQDCDYKQKKFLEETIAEQEVILRNLHVFTYEMQRVKDNYDVITKKIYTQLESNFDLEQKIKSEDRKFNQMTALIKEYKVQMNEMARVINEIQEGKLVSNPPEKEDLHYSTENFNNIETEYTNNRVTTTSYINASKCEDNTISFLSKNYQNLTNKLKNCQKLKKINTPENRIYSYISSIIDKFKKNPNIFLGRHGHQLISENSETLPYQNQDFRRLFTEELLGNPQLLDILKMDQTSWFGREIIKKNK